MASYQDINTIANDSLFQGRCLYALEVAAVNVMSEDNKTNQHGIRTNFAIQILNGSIPGLHVSLAVLVNQTIAGEADVTKISTTAGIPDSDIQFAVNSLYNALAGIGS